MMAIGTWIAQPHFEECVPLMCVCMNIHTSSTHHNETEVENMAVQEVPPME